MTARVNVDSSLASLLEVLHSQPGVRNIRASFWRMLGPAEPVAAEACIRLALALQNCSTLRSLTLVSPPTDIVLVVAEVVRQGFPLEQLTLSGRCQGVWTATGDGHRRFSRFAEFNIKVETATGELSHCNGWYTKCGRGWWRHGNGYDIYKANGVWTLSVDSETTMTAPEAEGNAHQPPNGTWQSPDGCTCQVTGFHSNSDVEHVASAFACSSTIRTLSLRGQYAITGHAAEMLIGCTTLESLTLMGLGSCGKTFEMIGQITSLRSFTLEVRHLRHHPVHVRNGRSGGSNWGDPFPRADVLDMLRHNSSITSLKFEYRRHTKWFKRELTFAGWSCHNR